MATTGIPSNFLLFNAESSKNLAYVIKITGVPDVFTSTKIGTRILFGDPGVTFGTPGLVFGGLRSYVNADGSTFRPYLDLESSSMQLNQRIEPEQGKSTVSTVNLSFIDYQGYMTQVCSPGVIIPDILGAEVQIFIGYAEISYPQDFFRVFRGYVSQVEIQSGRCTLQVSDANLKRRQSLFYTAKTTTTATFSSSATSLSVGSTDGFYVLAFGPDGGIDAAVTPYVQVNGNEWLVTEPSGTTSFGSWLDPNVAPHNMTRSQRGTTADPSLAAGSTVQAGIQLSDDPMSMALKIMLSGWDGPWVSGVPLLSMGPYPDPNPWVNTSNEIVLPSRVDAVGDYGLVAGDWLSLQNSPLNPSLGYYQISGFGDLDGQSNRVIFLTTTVFKEGPTPGTASFRSQFDTYPVGCGLQLTPKDVDVQGHIDLKNQFLGNTPNLLTIFVTDTVDSGKQFIEQEIYLAAGCYSVTKRGLLSVGLTVPPLAGSTLQVLDKTNILNGPDLKMTRMANSRYFYDEVDYEFDAADDGQTFQSTIVLGDSDAITNIGISQPLTVASQGLRTFTKPTGSGATAGAPGTYPSPTDAGIYITRFQKNLLSRFKAGSAPLEVKVNWQVGCLIEPGDTVQVNDNGSLFLANFTNGTRDLGSQLLFVTERTLDLKAGMATLQLIPALSTLLSDRFATISPASLVDTGSSTTTVILQPGSFGELFGAAEYEKWTDLIGLNIIVHNANFSTSGQTVLTGFDTINPLKMLVSPALSFTPASGYIVELANYPSTTTPTDQQAAKTVYAFIDETATVVTGIDASNFTVSSGDVSKFFVGCPVRVHSADYTTDSGDTDFTVQAINVGTNKITLTSALTFTPSTGLKVDLLGFPDGTGPYRWL